MEWRTKLRRPAVLFLSPPCVQDSPAWPPLPEEGLDFGAGQGRPSATAAPEENILRVSRKTPCASQRCLLARLQRRLGHNPATFLHRPLLLRASCGREHHPRAGKALKSGLFPAKNLPDAILHIFEMAPRVSFSVEGRRFNESFVLCS